jgi:hypothetical protein
MKIGERSFYFKRMIPLVSDKLTKQNIGDMYLGHPQARHSLNTDKKNSKRRFPILKRWKAMLGMFAIMKRTPKAKKKEDNQQGSLDLPLPLTSMEGLVHVCDMNFCIKFFLQSIY